MHRKILHIVLLSLVCTVASAAVPEGLLQKMATSTVKASFRLYEVGVDGMVAKGTITTYAGRYLLDVAGGYRIYNDGTTKYTVNHTDKEVVVENMTAYDDVATVLRGDNYKVDGDAIYFTWKNGGEYKLALSNVEILGGNDVSIYSPGEFPKDYIITDIRDE